MIGFPLALLASNAAEWAIHKYLLHGRGKDKSSFWSFHWYDHHKNARRHENKDDMYDRSVFHWDARGKEALGLVVIAAAAAPLLRVAPFFVAGVWYSTFNYYRVHKRCHQDPAWGRENLPWHVDHHMGPDQHQNWCVTRPWFDVILGTRRPYVGTAEERADQERHAKNLARRASKAQDAQTQEASIEFRVEPSEESPLLSFVLG